MSPEPPKLKWWRLYLPTTIANDAPELFEGLDIAVWRWDRDARIDSSTANAHRAAFILYLFAGKRRSPIVRNFESRAARERFLAQELDKRRKRRMPKSNSKTEKEPKLSMNDAQHACVDFRNFLMEALDHVSAAESCETEADCRANLEQLLENVECVAKDAKAILAGKERE